MVGIRVDANVDRENAIFLTGETVNVHVTLRNIVKSKNSLAWGCVQLHCDQILGKFVGSSSDEKPKTIKLETALPTGKTSIFSSKPTIIFCDVQLSPSEVLEYSARFDIPFNVPPSFKGNFVKYFWYVTVAVQHVDTPVKMLQLPLRVINLSVAIDLPPLINENPFLYEATKNPPLLEFAKSAIDEITSTKIPKYFKINDGNATFAMVAIFRNNFKLGDDIICRITFDTLSKVRCSVLTLRLETVEEDLLNPNTMPFVQVHAVKYMVTMFMKDCHCLLSIPGNSVPSFDSDTIKLSWRLHFDFLVGNAVTVESKAGSSNVDKYLNCERIAWDHSITVFAANPFNVNLAYTQSTQSVSDTV